MKKYIVKETVQFGSSHLKAGSEIYLSEIKGSGTFVNGVATSKNYRICNTKSRQSVFGTVATGWVEKFLTQA